MVIKARLHGGVRLEQPDKPRLRRSPVVDALGRRLWDRDHVRDTAGRTGIVERTLGVPPGPWAARGCEKALGRLEVLWDDGEREFLVKASTVVKLKTVKQVPR
jgi:hypothetical protein